MAENPFSDRYRSLSNSELLDILDNPSQYQVGALEAAREELSGRHLTEEELMNAREELSVRKRVVLEKEQGVQRIANRMNEIFSLIALGFSPRQEGSASVIKAINIISLLLAGQFLYGLYKDFGLLQSLVGIGFSEWDTSVVVIFLEFIWLPVATLLLWLRKKSGWILTVMLFFYKCATSVVLFVGAIRYYSSEPTLFDQFFPSIPPIYYVGTFLLFAVLAFTMLMHGMRTIYRIGTLAILSAIALGIVLGLGVSAL